jgi:hypothetical protein
MQWTVEMLASVMPNTELPNYNLTAERVKSKFSSQRVYRRPEF